MLCYKDTTFCPFLECRNIACEIRYTEKVKNDARRWWGNNDEAPVSLFLDKPECFEEPQDD